MTMTRGTGLMSHIFDGFAAVKGEIPDRHNGVLISNEEGVAVAYALFALQERGRMFVSPGEKLYEELYDDALAAYRNSVDAKEHFRASSVEQHRRTSTSSPTWPRFCKRGHFSWSTDNLIRVLITRRKYYSSATTALVRRERFRF